MADYVIDTNVLVIASAADDESPFPLTEIHLPKPEWERVLLWLQRFRDRDDQHMVWDAGFTLHDEYRNKLGEMDYGIRVLQHKWDRCLVRWVSIEYDEHNRGVIPDRYHGFDGSDRSALAVLLAESGKCELVIAEDTDWLSIERVLERDGVRLHLVTEEWLRLEYKKKYG